MTPILTQERRSRTRRRRAMWQAVKALGFIAAVAGVSWLAGARPWVQ